MITNKQVLAAACSLNNCKEDVAKDILGKRGFERLRAALTAAEKAAWRPISEAPKDDTILVSVEATKQNFTFFGRPSQTHPAYIDEHGRACNIGTWLPDAGLAGEFWQATHFRPLPKGPSDE